MHNPKAICSSQLLHSMGHTNPGKDSDQPNQSSSGTTSMDTQLLQGDEQDDQCLHCMNIFFGSFYCVLTQLHWLMSKWYLSHMRTAKAWKSLHSPKFVQYRELDKASEEPETWLHWMAAFEGSQTAQPLGP